MRIATQHAAQNAFEGIGQRQAVQDRLQTQLGTGRRVRTPGDDPVGAAQAELARSRLARLAQDERATALAGTLLSSAESALGRGVDLLQGVRESLVAAGNGAYSPQEKKSLALQLRAAREQLLALANTSDGAGGFVFGGQGLDTAPANGAAPAWLAPDGVQRIGEGGRYAASVDGRASFMALPQGNGVFTTASDAANTGTGWVDPGTVTDATALTGHAYRITIGGAPGSLTYTLEDLDAGTTLVNNGPLPADGTLTFDGQRLTIGGTPSPADRFHVAPSQPQSVFRTLDDAIALLEGPATGGAYHEQLQRVQTSLDRALDGMTLMRSRIGAELKTVDDAVADGQNQSLSAQALRSSLQDLDYAQAISELQANQTGLEAALKAYATIGRTSLFQLIS